MESKCWGILTTIDLVGCDKTLITNSNKLVEYCKKIVQVIDMTAYLEPIIHHFGTDKSVAGYSMVQFIQTSLISGHFVDETSEACIDIFSCKDYDSNMAAEFTKDFFKAQFYVHYRVPRGVRMFQNFGEENAEKNVLGLGKIG